MNNKKSLVYVAMTADLLHSGHINILKNASKYGEVIVGLYTYDACRELNDVPYLSYEKRKAVLSEINLVSKIIPQTEASYKNNLMQLRPNYVVHGDDWKTNFHKKYREEVIFLLKKWKGKLVEVAYSKDIDNLKIKDESNKKGIDFISRLSSLKNLLYKKKIIKILEVHSPLCGMIIDNVSIFKKNKKIEFDGMWSSSLTDSTLKGMPDTESVDVSSRLNVINQIFEVAKKPLIYDGDTGGISEHFKFTVRSLERLGVSAIIIEDKKGLKRNSLFGKKVFQEQESIKNFCKKIIVGKKAQRTSNFMIIARIESLILEKGINDALARAHAYVNAGVDGIMIHSKRKDFKEVETFIKKFRSKNNNTVLVCVPTTYNKVKIDKFEKLGVNIVIYANHMLRSSYPAMVNTAKSILKNERTYEVDKKCMPIKNILELIPETKN